MEGCREKRQVKFGLIVIVNHPTTEKKQKKKISDNFNLRLSLQTRFYSSLHTKTKFNVGLLRSVELFGTAVHQ